MHLHWLGGFESRQGASYTLGLETEECKSSVLGDCEMGFPILDMGTGRLEKS